VQELVEMEKVKGFCRFPVSRLNTIKCIETGETTQSFEKVIFQGILLFLIFIDIFCNKKCLETRK
jgi:hypothetical protein